MPSGLRLNNLKLTSSESPSTVDIPTEMKKLHPDGERFALDYIPRQLNFSTSDVEAKLKQFPQGPVAVLLGGAART